MVNYMEIIGQYNKGKINLKQLSDFIDERLFDLRQSPDPMTEEQENLSSIELLICEIKDGFRNIYELEEFAKSLLIPESTSIICIWDNAYSKKSIISSSSNRDVEIVTASQPTLPPAVDYRLQGAFA